MIKLKSLLQEQTTLFKRGMRDPQVGTKTGPIAKIQQKLIDAGIMNPIPDTSYGIYGPKTKAAVEKFQTANKLKKVDGIVGPKTTAALNKTSSTGDDYKFNYSSNSNIPGSSTYVASANRNDIERRLNTPLGTTIANADRINKELYFINARPQYNDKPFFIVDPRLNLVFAFDKQHKLVDYSQSIASADKQQDVIFTKKDWCELSSKTKNPEKYGYGERTYEKINGVDTCVRTHNGKKYVSGKNTAASDETLYQGKTYAYDVLGAENKRYAQKGIYGIRSKFYQSGYEGQEGIPNAFMLKKDGVAVGTAIHALVPTGNRLVADKELKGLLQKDLNFGTIPQEYIDMVEKDFLSPKSKYDLSSGCFNVDPEFIQNPKVQEISNYPDVPVFIMGEQDTDYLVQVAPGKEGEFMLDLAGKEGECVSPSSLEGRYGVRVDSVA